MRSSPLSSRPSYLPWRLPPRALPDPVAKTKTPCPTVGQGKAKAKDHAKKAKQASGKGKKCGHRPPTTVPPIVDPAPTGGGEDGTGGTPPTDGGTGDAPQPARTHDLEGGVGRASVSPRLSSRRPPRAL
jgi:hypothetical protein